MIVSKTKQRLSNEKVSVLVELETQLDRYLSDKKKHSYASDNKSRGKPTLPSI